ncbi:MAG: 50S ribosomal protein L25 [Candidatus Marinimicrobia bacterium]|nr:50S ribosomal protein L25 [Candidatus Neomarinimicrobiota bacterium]|tara:strand:- start:7604 stop:8320 length:717 start_codon:yes stop_codon:yes gene_type:complete
MESFFKLKVDQRDKTGNAATRSLRRSGKVPVNYYYQGEANQNMSIDKKILHKAIQSGQHVFEMELDGNTIYVTFKEAQYHPVTEEIIHIDLLRVRRDVKMNFSIPLNLVGDAVGSVEGGIVSQAASSVELECFPTNVPDSIDVDITNLELNGTLTAIDIDLPEDTVLLSPEDTTIAVCAPPQAEIEPEVEEDEELEEGEEPTDGEESTDDKEGAESDKSSEGAKKEDGSSPEKGSKEE